MLPLRGSSCVTMLSSVLSFCHVFSTIYSVLCVASAARCRHYVYILYAFITYSYFCTICSHCPAATALFCPFPVRVCPCFCYFFAARPYVIPPTHPGSASLRLLSKAELPPPPAPLLWPSNGAGYAAYPTLPFVSRPPPATNVAFFVALSFALLTAFLACKINKQSIKINQSAVCIFQNNNNNISQ